MFESSKKVRIMFPSGENKAIVNNVEIRYHVAGTGPFCLVHPGGPGLDWKYFKMPLLEKFLTLIYLEPVGSGLSERLHHAADYTMKRYASDIEELRKHLDLNKFILLGHSHGGMVAQYYATQNKHRLKALILYGTSPTTGEVWQKDIAYNMKWFKNEPWFKTASKAMADEAKAETDEEFSNHFKKEIGFYFANYTSRKEEFDRHFESVRLSLPPYQGFVREAPFFDVRSQLASILCPTLIIVGEKDFVCSTKFSRQMHGLIRNSKLIIVENSGHMLHIESKEVFAGTVKQFISSLTG